MRRTILLLLMLAWAAGASAQNDFTTTPNLGLKKPKIGSTNGGIYVNQDFDTLDAAIGVFHGGFVSVPFSATPVFDLTKGNTFAITLSGNVTSSTMNQPGIKSGQILYLIACQNATGGFTFAFPSNFQSPSPVTVSPNANVCSASTWVWDGLVGKWINVNSNGAGAGVGAPLPFSTVAFSATPSFSGTLNAAYGITLTGNVTSSSVSGTPVNGVVMKLHICQGAGSPWTFAFPANFLNTTAIQTTGCTDETFSFDGTNWSQLTQPAGGGGGGGNCSSSGGQGNIQAAGTAGACQPTNLNESSGVLTNGDDNINRGPNPSVDMRKFGVVAVAPTAVPAPTVTGTSGTNTVTVSTTAGLQVGMGFSFVGGGATQSMTPPVAPTVTPVCAAGPLGTGFVVAAGAGATTRSWQISLRDQGQGLTAASSAGVTTTGNATPGAHSQAITSIASGVANTFTATIASSAELAPGCQITINGTTNDAEFGGVKTVASVPDGTHITYTSGVNAAVAISTTTATGGNVRYFLGDHLALPTPGAGGLQYEIYLGGTKVAESLIANLGYTDTTYNTWDYWGATISGGYPVSWWAPTTAPVSPVNDTYTGCISNIAGTTLTLVNCSTGAALNLGNSVTGAQGRFDNAPNIAACVSATNASAVTGAGGTCRFPVVVENNASQVYCYEISTFLDLTGVNAIIQDGTVCLRDTLKFNGNWYGTDLSAKRMINPSFGLRAHIPIFVFTANPGIWMSAGSSGLNKVDVHVFNNGVVGVFNTGANGAQVFEDDSFFSASANDYMNVLFYDYQSSAAGAFGFKFRNSSFIANSVLNGGQAQVGQTTTPAFISKFNTLMNFDYITGSTRGIYIVPHVSGLSGRFIGGEEWQGNITPIITFQPYYAGNTAGFYSIMDLYNDTGPAPMVAYIPSPAASLGATIQINGSDLPSANGPLVSGSPFASLILQNISATNALQLGQNMNTTSIGQTNGSLPGIRTASLATAAVNYTGNHTLTKAEGAVNAQGTLTFTIDTTLGDGQMWDVYSETGTTTLTVSAGTLHGNAATGNITIPNNSGMHVFLKGGNAYAYGLGGGGGGGGCTPGGTTNASLYNGGGGTCAGVNSPTVNGNYILNYNVTASASVAPTINLPGVPVNPQTGATYTLLYSDRGSLITATNAGAQTYTLVNPSSTGFGSNYFFVLKNAGTGAVTMAASGFTINGAASLVVLPGWTMFTWSDGVNYLASRLLDFSGIVDCKDVGGNHLNMDATTPLGLSCGTSASGNGLSGMTTGQVPIANTATSVTSSKALAGAGTGIVTGPTSSVNTDLVDYSGTGGQTADSGVLLANVWRKDVANISAAVNHDFSAGTIKLPAGAGATASASSNEILDTTNKNVHDFVNGADSIRANFASAPTTGDCIKGIITAGNLLLADGGGLNCGIQNTTTTNPTTAVTGNSCSAAATTVTMTGLTSTMTITFTPNADITASVGWGSTGGLVIVAWPTTNTVNYKICNQTGSSITPGAVTWNVSAR